MNARWALLAGLIVVAGSAPAQAQGLLERLGKIAREAGKAAEQAAPGAVPPDAGEVPPPPNVAPAPGDVAPPGYLGLSVDEPALGTPGAPVVGVREGSPAADAGFRPGDLVLTVDGTPINALDDFEAAMIDLHAGDRVRIKYKRQGAVQNVSVRLAERGAPAPAADSRSGVPFRTPRDPVAGSVTGQRASLGVTVMPLSDEARRRYGLNVARGALVTGVRPGGPAERAGIPIGAAIVALDGKRVDAAEVLIDHISTSRPGQEVEVTYYDRDRLQRKNIILGASDAGPTRPLAVDPGAPAGGDRPLLRRLEGVLDNIGAGGALDIEVDPAAARAPAGAAATDLRRQIEELQITVDRLNKRVKDLEARLGDRNSEVPPPPPLAPPKND
jgi:hypothetical protein